MKHLSKSMLVFSCTLLFAGANAIVDSTHTIEAVNNSAQAFRIHATNADQTLRIEQIMPAYTALMITAKLTSLATPQERLYMAIVNDSAQGVRDAINAGANFRVERNGQSPLVLAAALNKFNAASELLKYNLIG